MLPRSGAIQYVGLSAAPGGRLWVWWVEGNAVEDDVERDPAQVQPDPKDEFVGRAGGGDDVG